MISAYRQAIGVDFVDQYLNMVLGLPVSLEAQWNKAVIQKGVFRESGLVLDSAFGYDRFKENPAVFDFIEVTKPGEKVLGHPDNYPKPIYYYGLVGNERLELQIVADALEQSIDLKFR